MSVTNVVIGECIYRAVSGRDFVLMAPLDVSFDLDGVTRRFCIPPGWRFGPGVQSTPAVWRLLVNPFHLIESSCVHDVLYATRGGRREERTQDGKPIVIPFHISRADADNISRAIAGQHGINGVQKRLVHRILRLLGQNAWDD